MAYRVDWARSGLADLQAVVRHIACDDPEAARRFGERLLVAVESVSEFPRLGKVVREFRDDTLREVVVPPFRLVYEIDDNQKILTVLRVWHGARGDVTLEG